MAGVPTGPPHLRRRDFLLFLREPLEEDSESSESEEEEEEEEERLSEDSESDSEDRARRASNSFRPGVCI